MSASTAVPAPASPMEQATNNDGPKELEALFGHLEVVIGLYELDSIKTECIDYFQADANSQRVVDEILAAEREALLPLADKDIVDDTTILRCIVLTVAINKKKQRSQALTGLNPASAVVSSRKLDPKESFHQLLDRTSKLVSKKGVLVYADFIAGIGYDQLFDMAKKSLDSWVWKDVLEDGKGCDPTFWKKLKENNHTHEAGWYLIVLFPADGTLDGWAAYAGQSGDVAGRLAKHESLVQHTADERKLLYEFWRGEKGCANLQTLPYKAKKFQLGINLSGLIGEDDNQFNNVVEMYLSVMLRGLQQYDIAAWLPAAVIAPLNGPIGLQVALPLWQAHQDESKASFIALHNSEVSQIQAIVHARSVLKMAKAREAQCP